MTSESENTSKGAIPPESVPEVTGFAPLTDLNIGLMFLTRLPTAPWRNRPLARAAWCFPLIGTLVGLLGGLIYWGALLLLPSGWIAALLAIAATAIVTGALHEDGFSDAFDGLWGGHEPARRLEIMRDSNIGGYGALALMINVGLRASALVFLFDPKLVLLAMVAAHALSRAQVVWCMNVMPLAGKPGLAARAGRPNSKVTLIALVLGLGMAIWILHLLLEPILILAVCGSSLLAGWLFMALVRRKMGGYNGDTLGAAQQITEIALFLALASAYHWSLTGLNLPKVFS
ncbi:adenosylcobinamide-GDP ribazoletransferase [Aestuariispira insulae]|uniref:Adenosylcobinamide-GDP ribazoletransferase n=1 Tax=Aestuariispira insulae TaxID=1461337 RepID=A0A3D9HDW5_9PROT|nr:adenosylcobinamide-GDP ribazoletransferase [Aestuariispira insulae]RED47665.1 cobalamin-5'-phosphate synthase [Aestuariispira insulae]